jgi:hypothetical protein
MGDAGTDSAQSGLSRRQLLVTAGVAAGGLAAVGAAGAGSAGGQVDDSSGKTIGGVLLGVTGANSLQMDPAESGIRSPLDVEVQDGAVLLREGKATLSDFVAGDEVAVAGDFTPTGSFAASSVQSIYRVVDAEVSSRDGSSLRTDQGKLRLGSNSKAEGGTAAGHELRAEPLDELGRGDHVVVLGRRDPRSPELLVSRVGVVEG